MPLADLALLALWAAGRHCRPAMNALQTYVTGPLRAAIGRVVPEYAPVVLEAPNASVAQASPAALSPEASAVPEAVCSDAADKTDERATG